MAKIDFGGVLEDVVTAEEFSLEKARYILKDEIVAVLGYGVQGPGQALNMRDSGINVIVGQREGGRSWQRAMDDGFVPGKTLFSLEEAAQRGTLVQFLVSDAGTFFQLAVKRIHGIGNYDGPEYRNQKRSKNQKTRPNQQCN